MDRSSRQHDLWKDPLFPNDEEDIWAQGFTVPVPKQSRTSVRRFLCWDSHQFMVLINDPRVSDPRSYQGRKFRRIFRVPYIVFKDYIMKEIIEKKFWTIKQPSGYVP